MHDIQLPNALRLGGAHTFPFLQTPTIYPTCILIEAMAPFANATSCKLGLEQNEPKPSVLCNN